MTEPWLYALVGLSILAGVILFRVELMFLFKHEKVEGTIINWLKAKQQGKEFFYPLISFRDHGGEPIEFRAEERCEGRPLFPPGTKVIIKYLPGKPEFRKVKYPRPGEN